MSRFELFKRLERSWRYTRTIKERISGAFLGASHGNAYFTPVSTDENSKIMHYREEGVLIDPSGQQFETRQEYLYIYRKQTDSIEKHFSKEATDAGLFYVLDFDSSKQKNEAFSAIGAHLCVNDNYQAKYQFLSFSQFKLDYTVMGPAKNYVASTLFENFD